MGNNPLKNSPIEYDDKEEKSIKDTSLNNLLSKLKASNIEFNEELITKAYNITKDAHAGQTRKSDEPYFIHPFNVAWILIELDMDEATIIAGLLHDVLEDTDTSFEELKTEFSEEIATLVDGVTKLKKLKFKSKQDNQAENIRKMVMAMANDIRVVIIKLADRLHNMRTMKYMTMAKRFEKSTETMEIYAPLAHRLGISSIKWELEDLSFKYLEPSNYETLRKQIAESGHIREEYIADVIEVLKKKMDDAGIKCEITGRPKNIYSIYSKMNKQNKTYDQIYDSTAVRIIVDTKDECYRAMGHIYDIWKPVPGRYKDYIAVPKQNMYQSIHTTVMGPKGVMFEVQIRTWEMHRTAEYGIAAHWKYKEGGKTSNYDDKLQWLRMVMEWQKDVKDSKEFMDSLKGDLFSEEVYVFSPKGDIIELPSGSTPIDFAYRVHTAVGDRCVGAKIDGRMVPINTKLKTGNRIEILTSSASPGPSIDWLKIVKTSQARNKIRQWFKKAQRDENVIKGRELLEKEVKRQGFKYDEILRDDWLEQIYKKLSFNNLDDMFSSIGYGSTPLTQVMPKLRELYKEQYKEIPELDGLNYQSEKPKQPKSVQGIKFIDVDNLDVKFARCCNPVPGDEILGYITRGRGVSIHRTDCPNMQSIDRARLIEVSWDTSKESSYVVHLNVLAYDQVGYLNKVTKVMFDMGLNIASINARKNKDKTFSIDFMVEIKGKEQIEQLFKRVMAIDGSLNMYRVKA